MKFLRKWRHQRFLRIAEEQGFTPGLFGFWKHTSGISLYMPNISKSAATGDDLVRLQNELAAVQTENAIYERNRAIRLAQEQERDAMG